MWLFIHFVRWSFCASPNPRRRFLSISQSLSKLHVYMYGCAVGLGLYRACNVLLPMCFERWSRPCKSLSIPTWGIPLRWYCELEGRYPGRGSPVRNVFFWGAIRKLLHQRSIYSADGVHFEHSTTSHSFCDDNTHILVIDLWDVTVPIQTGNYVANLNA